MFGLALKRRQSPPSMSVQDIDQYFGWTKTDRTRATRHGFPAPVVTNGEALWRQDEVEQWARARGLPDPAAVFAARSGRFWHELLVAVDAFVHQSRERGCPLQVLARPTGFGKRVSMLPMSGRETRAAVAVTLRDRALLVARTVGETTTEATYRVRANTTGLEVVVDGRGVDAARFVAECLASPDRGDGREIG